MISHFYDSISQFHAKYHDICTTFFLAKFTNHKKTLPKRKTVNEIFEKDLKQPDLPTPGPSKMKGKERTTEEVVGLARSRGRFQKNRCLWRLLINGCRSEKNTTQRLFGAFLASPVFFVCQNIALWGKTFFREKNGFLAFNFLGHLIKI